MSKIYNMGVLNELRKILTPLFRKKECVANENYVYQY